MSSDNINAHPVVQRNTVRMQRRLEELLGQIDRAWDADCELEQEQRNPCGISGVLQQALVDAASFYGETTLEEFITLALGCGCCRRHAHGFYCRGYEHCSSYENDLPETRTPANKPCSHTCRHYARIAKGCLNYMELHAVAANCNH